jgi:hypothetical protein
MPDQGNGNDALADGASAPLPVPPLAMQAYVMFRSWETLWQRQPAEYLSSEIPEDVQTTIRVYLQGLEEMMTRDAQITFLMTTATTGDPTQEVRMTRLAALDIIVPVAAYLGEALGLSGKQSPPAPGSRPQNASRRDGSRHTVSARLPDSLQGL